MSTLETDYLVVGSGAVGMAFVDTIIDETDAHVTLVDKRSRPGGHWNDAYPFVTLHQPSAYYGVNSKILGTNRKDVGGINDGMYELASGAEINGYYDSVLREKLLPSGRVRYLPMTEYKGDDQLVSLMSGQRSNVRVRRKIVDATHGSPAIPADHQRKFRHADGLCVIPPGELPALLRKRTSPPRRFVVLGAGKTGMDTVTWLLNTGTTPDSIQWIKPRESWLINRAMVQPGLEFFEDVFTGMTAQYEAFAEGTSAADIFHRLEASGMMVRVDPAVEPAMFHYATISKAEIEQLQTVKNVVRKGRVEAIDGATIQLAEGSESAVDDAVYIDCTASAVAPRESVDVFQTGLIVPQFVRMPQPAFSAALIAHIETRSDSDEEKNRLTRPIQVPHTLDDYISTNLLHMANQYAWLQDEDLTQWIRGSRLDGYSRLAASAAGDNAKQAILFNLQRQAQPAMANLMRLAAALQQTPETVQ